MNLFDKFVKFVFFCSKVKTFLVTEIEHFIDRVRKGTTKLWKEYVEEKYPTEK